MKKIKQLSVFQMISLGFMVLILTGAVLLMLPFATKGPGHASFFDALFTSTSACCVTGLVVQDTATYWSVFGQFIILVLIQIGGLGVITFAIAISLIAKQKIGLLQRTAMQTAMDVPQIGGIVQLTKYIFQVVLLIEVGGAILLFSSFYPVVGLRRGIWYSIFHSISAYCNAGFDLMGYQEKFSSLTSFQGDPVMNATIMALIILGGIGFLTMFDIKKNGFHIKRYSLQTKVVLTVTLLLLVLPFVYNYFVEFQRNVWSELSVSERVYASAFQSVTTRTAGFNTVDFSKMLEPTIFIMIILMLIGGSPGSTAGGVKTTTIAVLIAGCVAVFKRDGDVHIFRRRIDENTFRSAAVIFTSYVFLFSVGSLVISITDHVPLLSAMFEAASAVGTVGLTLGITSTLGATSKIVLIILMFFGRAGALTILFAALPKKKNTHARFPQEKVSVG